MKKLDYELQVVVGGKRIPEYGSNGLVLVEGRQDHKFTLKFRNDSASRVLAIPSIDGLDIISGKPATKDSQGYLVDAFSSMEFTGWRVSLDQVNRFIFKAKAKSYVASKGHPEGAGVIGVMVIAENPPKPKVVVKEVHVHHDHFYPPTVPHLPPWRPRPYRVVPMWDSGDDLTGTSVTFSAGTEMKSTCAPNHGILRSMAVNTMSNAAPDLNLGTGWGEQIESKVVEVAFQRGAVLAVLEIHYTDAKGLVAAGIDVHKKQQAVSAPVLPRAFSGFCKPPKALDEVEATT